MTLTKIEKEILRNPAKGLIKSNKMAWNDLKREIFDFGYQSWYYSQEEFKKPAIAAIFSLNDDAKRALIKEWKHMPLVYELKTDNEILNQYALVLVELIVTRAWKSKASNF